jgi:hypothetical protein
MAFCPHCGATVPDGAAFCGTCGKPILADAASPSAAYSMAPEQPQRPAPGRIQEPSQVLWLSAVTLTVYFYVWLWRVTGEVDAYANRPGESRNLARVGIVAAILGLVVSATVAIAYSAPAAISRASGGAVAIPAWVSYASLVSALAVVLVTLALRRVWAILADDARAHGRPPLNPGMLTAMSLVSVAGTLVTVAGAALASPAASFNPLSPVGGLLSLAGLVLWFVVLHRTQSELNAAWRAAQARPA